MKVTWSRTYPSHFEPPKGTCTKRARVARAAHLTTSGLIITPKIFTLCSPDCVVLSTSTRMTHFSAPQHAQPTLVTSLQQSMPKGCAGNIFIGEEQVLQACMGPSQAAHPMLTPIRGADWSAGPVLTGFSGGKAIHRGLRCALLIFSVVPVHCFIRARAPRCAAHLHHSHVLVRTQEGQLHLGNACHVVNALR